jgi:chromosome segregation protein
LLLEEAAGISGLHARRKDAEQKLRAAEANLTRLGEILGEQEQRASQLRRQARAAERYRKLTGEIREVEARLLHARWVEAEASADKARAEAANANEQVELIARAIAEAQAAQEAANQALAEKRDAYPHELEDLMRLDGRVRALTYLVEVEGRPIAEAGEMVEMSPTAARVALMRARRRLRAELSVESAGE